MGKIDLMPGDVFATNLGGTLGWLIKKAEALKSNDCEALYSHTGIILDSKGTTFEALWTVKNQNLFEAYAGADVLIARWACMNEISFQKGYDAVKIQSGHIYPVARLFLHLFNIGKIHLPNHHMVCSEMTSCFLIYAGARTMSGQNPYGVTPDNHVDEWRINRDFNIIFEGKLEVTNNG